MLGLALYVSNKSHTHLHHQFLVEQHPLVEEAILALPDLLQKSMTKDNNHNLLIIIYNTIYNTT